MVERDRTDAPGRDATRPAASSRPAPAAGPASALARSARPSPAQALSLQRAAGNRTAGRILARWAPHPDKEKKGMLLSDGAAAEYNRFNVPLGK